MSLNGKLTELEPDAYLPMGNTAENVARQFKVSREDQDAFALRSHQKAVAAWAEGRFAAEVVPVKTRVFEDGRWQDVTVDRDEGPRADTTAREAGGAEAGVRSHRHGHRRATHRPSTTARPRW